MLKLDTLYKFIDDALKSLLCYGEQNHAINYALRGTVHAQVYTPVFHTVFHAGQIRFRNSDGLELPHLALETAAVVPDPPEQLSTYSVSSLF